MRWFLLPAVLFCLAPLRAAPPAPTRLGEDAVYVYDVFRDASVCADVVARLRQLPLRRTVILSVEQGSEFILDRAKGEPLLACVLQHLRASARTVKALLLQDPSFLAKGEEAVRRAVLVGEFAARHPRQLSGAQVDVEPYTVEKWSCCNAEERRRALRDLHQLLGRVRRQLRGLPLGVAAPWWYPAVTRELPEAAPEAFLEVADELYLMAYGDEGGPLVGGEAERVLARVDAPEFFPGSGRVHIALATYEFRSPAHFQAELEKVRRRLAAWPTFAGTAVFHAASGFNFPLARLVSGTVTDEAGDGLPDVEIEAAGIRGRTNMCGQFLLRGLPDGKAELILRKEGFRTRLFPVQGRDPGTIAELGNMAMEKEP